MTEKMSPRSAAKCELIVHGATQIFEREGFEGASVDMIAEAANVSKATLYKYFPNKEELFQVTIRRLCERYSKSLARLAVDEDDHDAVLMAMAGIVVRTFASRLLIDLFRLALAESLRFPELGRAFYEAGPQEATRQIKANLEQLVAGGWLAIDDCELAARQFKELCKAELFHLAVLGIRNDFSEEEFEQVARRAVDMFARAYAPDAPA